MSSARRPRRFGHRVFVVIALMLIVVSTLFTAYFLHVQRQRLEAAINDRGRGLAGLLATGAKIAVYSENPELAQETLQGVIDRRDVLAAAVFTSDRTLVTAAGLTPALKAVAAQLTPRDLALVQQLSVLSGCRAHDDPGVVDTFCPVLLRKRPTAESVLYFNGSPAVTEAANIGFARVTLDRAPLRRELVSLVLRNLALMLVVLLLCTGVAFRFARRVTEPLEQLTEAVRAFGAGAGGEIGALPGMPDDEIGRLAASFTRMTRDIAERDREKERLSERLREAQKMEAVGTLSQGISHDFKNILSTLKTAVHLLRKCSPENEMVLKYTGTMQTSVDRAQDLVERLVTFSRTHRIQAFPIDLNALLANLAPMLREAVGEGVRLELHPAPGPVRILGDEGSLGQLLLNLAYNGRDAMPQGGTLTIRLETIAGAAGGADPALITVRDTGVGMDPEVCRRIFEPFFTTKDVGGGMGLGLSIVRGIVEQHHGRIEVESEQGKGTTFKVELPLASEEAAAGGAANDGATLMPSGPA